MVYILEVEESEFAYFAEQLQADFIVLANLSRNQLNLYGELDSLVSNLKRGLELAPQAQAILCADDPLVAYIGAEIEDKERIHYYGLDAHELNELDNRSEHFLIEAAHCNYCGAELEYRGLSFSNFGDYYCPNGDFQRPERDLEFSQLGEGQKCSRLRFDFPDVKNLELELLMPSLMNAYNAAAAALLARLFGLSAEQTIYALGRCLPPRGRFERFNSPMGNFCLLRADNPEAYNATLAWALQQEDFGGLMLSLDQTGQEHSSDLSWLWDILFEKLPFAGQIGITGNRKYDLALRLRYASVAKGRLELAQNDLELLARFLNRAKSKTVYWLLDKSGSHRMRPELAARASSELDQWRQILNAGGSLSLGSAKMTGECAYSEIHEQPERKLTAKDSMGLVSLQRDRSEKNLDHRLRLAYLYPAELNLYGDRGNVLCLGQRARSRGIELEVHTIGRKDELNPSLYDLYFMGGGQDSDQGLVYQDFIQKAPEIRLAIESGAVFLCICGAYQLMGKHYLTAEQKLTGLGILPLETRAGEERMVGELLFLMNGAKPATERTAADLARDPNYLLGYENHGGETFLEASATPFGQVLYGYGNNLRRENEGAIYKNLYGTYAHGAFLPRNPAMADRLLELAWRHRYGDLPFPKSQSADEYAMACRAEAFKRLGLSNGDLED